MGWDDEISLTWVRSGPLVSPQSQWTASRTENPTARCRHSRPTWSCRLGDPGAEMRTRSGRAHRQRMRGLSCRPPLPSSVRKHRLALGCLWRTSKVFAQRAEISVNTSKTAILRGRKYCRRVCESEKSWEEWDTLLQGARKSIVLLEGSQASSSRPSD
jgi:hypothetical protein